jgi:hypothetical protein
MEGFLMTVPHDLLEKAYVQTFFALAMIAGLIAALLFGPFWIIESILFAMGLAIIAFCIWQPNHGGG